MDTQYAEDDDAKSYDVAVNLMQAHPDLKVIISSSAVSAPAAARAIQATGKAGQVFATGFALPNSIKSYLEDGSQKAFALWDPQELGYVAAQMAHQIHVRPARHGRGHDVHGRLGRRIHVRRGRRGGLRTPARLHRRTTWTSTTSSSQD